MTVRSEPLLLPLLMSRPLAETPADLDSGGLGTKVAAPADGRASTNEEPAYRCRGLGWDRGRDLDGRLLGNTVADVGLLHRASVRHGLSRPARPMYLRVATDKREIVHAVPRRHEG